MRHGGGAPKAALHPTALALATGSALSSCSISAKRHRLRTLGRTQRREALGRSGRPSQCARPTRRPHRARGQFQHGEAAVERRRPWVTAVRDCAVGRDEYGAARFHRFRRQRHKRLPLSPHRSPRERRGLPPPTPPLGTTIAALGKEIRYLAMRLFLWGLMTLDHEVWCRTFKVSPRPLGAVGFWRPVRLFRVLPPARKR